MQKKGFTLLEVLLVIALIGILLTIILVVLNPRERFAVARNDVRKSDIQKLEGALTQYRLQEGSYPAGLTSTLQEICDPDISNPSVNCGSYINLSSLVPTYIQSIPQDPQDTDSTGGSGYQVAVDVTRNVVALKAIQAESSATISINDPLSSALPSTAVNTPLAASNPSITSQTPPLVPNTGDVSLLLHADGSFADSSPNNFVPMSTGGTPGVSGEGVQISTTQSKFGGSSLFFPDVDINNAPYPALSYWTPESGGYNYFPEFSLGNTYTIEAWVYAITPRGGIVERLAGAFSQEYGYSMTFEGARIKCYFYGTFDGSGFQQYILAPSAFPTSTWVHVAMVRSGTNGALYINGESVGTINNLNTPQGSVKPVRIGSKSVGSGGNYNTIFFNGYIDDLRITKGVAIYTSNFTPPTSAF